MAAMPTTVQAMANGVKPHKLTKSWSRHLQQGLGVIVHIVGRHVHKFAGHAQQGDVDVGDVSDVGQAVFVRVLGFQDASLHLALRHCPHVPDTRMSQKRRSKGRQVDRKNGETCECTPTR